MQLLVCKYKEQTYPNPKSHYMDKIEKLNSFLKDNPQDSFVQHALALEHIKIGDDETAKKLFEAILQRQENYIGSYYHLAKLLERQGESAEAISWYEKGMEMAKKAGDNHAYNELQMALEDLD